jgi:predicted nuclease of predicted toxin-antitoxin system
MRLRDCGLLTDENIDPAVVAGLRQLGLDVWDVCESGWQGRSDVELLRRAFQERRVIVTHDSDFGTLAILSGEPCFGILYLRPGHIDSRFTLVTIQSLLVADPELSPPFVVVVKRSASGTTIRVRTISP